MHSTGVLGRKRLFKIWINNVPKTGEVNALKIEAVNKLNFETISFCQKWQRAELSAVRRWAELSAVPKSVKSGNGPKVQPVEHHLQVTWVQHERIV